MNSAAILEHCKISEDFKYCDKRQQLEEKRTRKINTEDYIPPAEEFRDAAPPRALELSALWQLCNLWNRVSWPHLWHLDSTPNSPLTFMMSCAASPYLCNHASQSHLRDLDLLHCSKSCISIECKFLELRRINMLWLHMVSLCSYYFSIHLFLVFLVHCRARPSAAAARREQASRDTHFCVPFHNKMTAAVKAVKIWPNFTYGGWCSVINCKGLGVGRGVSWYHSHVSPSW